MRRTPTLRRVTSDVVSAYLDQTPEPTRTALAELCRIIGQSDPRVRAEIKWNAPSFTIDDPQKLLEWKDADRAVVVFADEGDVRRNEQALTVILTEWIAQTQRLKS